MQLTGKNEGVKLVIADDHQLFRNGLRLLLESDNRFEIIAEACNGRELITIMENCDADLVLMDISMPVMDGIEATRKITEICPGTPVIALSMYGEEDYYYKMGRRQRLSIEEQRHKRGNGSHIGSDRRGKLFLARAALQCYKAIQNPRNGGENGQPLKERERDTGEDM